MRTGPFATPSQKGLALVRGSGTFRLSIVQLRETGAIMKKHRKNFALGGVLLGTAVFSTGCTLDEVLTLARIIALFI